MRKNTGFTLIEVLVAVVLTGMILVTGYSTFQQVMQAQSRLGATIDIQKNLFYTNEKLATLIREGGTIDYEEYFNRRMLGYAQSKVDTNNNPGDDIFMYTFSVYSHFGNGNNTGGRPTIYYCGVAGTTTGEACMDPSSNVLFDSSTYLPPPPPIPLTYHFTSTPPEHQPYGQYAALALNYLDPVGWPTAIRLPPIFKETPPNTIYIFDRLESKLVEKNTRTVGLPELYLIKENLDGTYDRTYFRHIYVQDPASTTPCTPATSIEGCLGRIQITKLTACDTLLAGGTAGSDGVIDAWIPQCDFNATAGTDCSDLAQYKTDTCPNGITILEEDIYKSAHEETISGTPDIDPNLAWVDVTDPDMNIVRATFLPSPLKIPALMSGAGDDTKSAQVSLYLEVTLSTKLRNKSFVLPAYNFPRTLITTYDLSE